MSNKNKELVTRVGLRFLRVLAGSVLSLLIVTLIDLLPQLDLTGQTSFIVYSLIIPGLVSLDKFLRDKGIY